MLCDVMLCHVMLCHVVLCYVMLCYVMLSYVMLYYRILSRITVVEHPTVGLCIPRAPGAGAPRALPMERGRVRGGDLEKLLQRPA